MRKTTRGSKVNVHLDRNCLVIGMSGDVTDGAVQAVIRKLSIQKKRMSHTIVDMVLDLSDARYIEPEGALYLVCLCSVLTTGKMKEIASPASFCLRRPPEGVLTYLTTLNFFIQMSGKARLLGCEDLVHLEHERRQRSRNEQASNTLDNHLNADDHPIIWPMETIDRKLGSIDRGDFEDTCSHFINNAYDQFGKLFSSSHFNFDEANMKEFFSANGELYKNIYEHSDSWGLGLIHARPYYGTTVCYDDIGIGVKESVNSSPKAGRQFEKFEMDYEAMKWALTEGHSSKISGDGEGLSIVEDFVLSRNGTVEIRSGRCFMYKKPGDESGEENWRVRNVPEFPGTQIKFFIPCATQ